MPLNTGPVSITMDPSLGCSYIFTDDGGVNNTYSASSGFGSVITFLPSAPGNKIVVRFTAFYTEAGFDGLFVYDGPDTGAPQISSGIGTTVLSGLPNPFSGGAGSWQGTNAPRNIAPGVVRATSANTSGALTFAFDSDQTIDKSGWVAIVAEVPADVCTMTASTTIPVAAQSGSCGADIKTTPPNIQPGACLAAFDLWYQINEGTAVKIPAPVPATITIPDVPVGVNVVSWQLTDPCSGGLVALAPQLVLVADTSLPVIDVPDDVVINLDPGACAAPLSYTVTAFDNCPSQPAGTVNHPLDFNNGAAGIMFDIQNLTTGPIVITEFGPALDEGTWPMEVYETVAAATWQGVESNPAAWSLAGTRSVVSEGPDTGTPMTDFAISLAPGASKGIYLTSSIGAPVRSTGMGSGIQREINDGALRVSSKPGASKVYPFGDTFQSRAFNGYVKYTSTQVIPQQLAGLPSGAEFPIGTTINIFQGKDKSGNTATASFKVSVLPYDKATSSLICAGTVNVSLDSTCTKQLNADDILLGGPYQCYDAYLVQVDKIPPFQDGPWVPAYLTSIDVGKSYGLRVTEPGTGNMCQGTVVVEDKLPPSLNVMDVELPCNFDTAPTHNALASMVNEFVPATVLPVSVSDFQTQEINIPVNVPADGLVEDIDVYLKVTGDVFEKNLELTLENPAGTKSLLWQQQTGCTGPLWVRFDDEGSGNQDCTDFTTNQHAQIPFNLGTLTVFDGKPLKGTWKLRVRDLNGFGDMALVEEVKLIVRYRATFSAGFPGKLKFPDQVTQVTQNSFVVPATLLDGCSDVTLSYTDELLSQPCSTGLSTIIKRSWTAKDANNNTSKVVQTIRLKRPDFTDLVLPPDFNDISAPAFECAGAFPTPNWIEGQGLQGMPYVFGKPNGCSSINWSFNDIVVDICPGSYTINRTWSIVDVCKAQSMQAMQLIQVLDREAPAMTCPANLTVSTDLYTCCATVDLPNVVVADACSAIASVQGSVVVFNQYSGDTTLVHNVTGALTNFPGNDPANPDTLALYGNTPCLPLGNHHVYYKVEDACGNLKSCSFTLSVRDYTPPVAVGHSLTTVALNADDPNDCYEPNADGIHFSGVATLSATAFDQGSYDNCNFIKVTVRRQPPYSDCILGLNHVNGAPPCQDTFPDLKSEYMRAISESDSIRFYCCEAGTTQTLVLRCYQLDALGKLSLGPNNLPLFNETLIKVEVQDKLKPGCQAPADVTVSCENFDPTLAVYGLPSLEDNCCLDATKKYKNKSGLVHELNSTQFDSLCNKGTLVRTFTVYDCGGQTSQCTQQIVVERDVNYAIKFPDDVHISLCDTSGLFGKPEFFGKDCELFGVSYTDNTYAVVPDACYYIERTWRVIDWCDYQPGGGCVVVPNPTPSATLNAPQNLIGPIVAPPGTPAPWSPTTVKVTSGSPQATDYSSFWSPTAKCYEYTQLIKVLDTKPPIVEQCADSPLLFGDLTLNASELWNKSYWTDNKTGSHNLCEGLVDLSTTGHGACAGASLNINYLLFLDLNGDDVQETVVNSADLPAVNTVMYGNAGNPNFLGGTARAFDQRPVPASEQYRFALQTAVSSGKLTAAVRWNTQDQPDSYVVPELPYGNHRVLWILADGCGNETLCENKFVVKDEKAPTVVCINGLSVNIMPDATVQLWATDFLQYAEDNYTPADQLQLGIRRAGTGTGFPFEADGVTPQSGVLFTCDDLGTQLVELWAIDLDGNADYCETYVIVQDNNGQCLVNSATVAGALKTENGAGLEAAIVGLTGSNPVIPIGGLFQPTDPDGKYLFPNLPMSGDITVSPMKDDDPLNGVSTFDLVLINKHILGLEPLSSPYRMIAADANNSRSLTTFDVVELRKLILGIYTNLPANSSWRFIDKTYNFPDPLNPFQTVFPEITQTPDLLGNLPNQDFISVKVGDVNGNAVTSSLISVEDRTSGELLFDVTPTGSRQEIKAGEVFTVNFQANQKVKGYQFTLYFPDMEVLEVTPESDGMSVHNFGIFNDRNCLTTSFDNERVHGAFAVTFRAYKSGTLSQMLKVSGQITKAEAYLSAEASAKADVLAIALRFDGQNGPVIAGQGFELYQNQPNPWTHRTQVGFYLPAATEAALTVYDEAGRLLYSTTGDFGQGYNAFNLDRTLLETTGVLYYKVKTPTDSAVKKMIQTK
ncbi:MAG: proprotein convertase P-domain-containing protein [Lewinellaceae bacterium]|nr:proprotein convertase P-domain-containing protein [Saprospiraceae bacterium]MCB9329939.1 proprotein convertase P-domain-containing protein [Lewinellaceae bacterium]